ncbi:MAG: NAD-dependent epimerase/dehydratase family protein [Patescibacteria group bacterium]
MNILIIGGSNFIGWRFVGFLEEDEHTITVINRGNRQRQYPSNIRHIISDRNDRERIKKIIEGQFYDVVYDMCASNGDDMKYTVDLFNGKTQKYVFISSAASYLEPSILPIAEDYKQGIHAIWGRYGGGKLECETILMDAYKNIGFPSVIIRPSYVYGIGNTIDRETFLFDRISKGRPILIPGDGDSVIQLGEVSDLCEALLVLGKSTKGTGECYNVSGNEYVTLNSLVSIVASIVKKDYKTISIFPAKYEMKDRDIFPFDNCTYFTSCKKFSEEFHWEPKVTLIEGLQSAYLDWVNSLERLATKYKNEDIVLADLSARQMIQKCNR